MLLIDCPFCGARDEREFFQGGPDFGPRPDDPGSLDDQSWIDQLTVPHNPLGQVWEWWCHERGCGEWFLVVRDTRTNEIISTESVRL